MKLIRVLALGAFRATKKESAGNIRWASFKGEVFYYISNSYTRTEVVGAVRKINMHFLLELHTAGFHSYKKQS